MCACVCVFMCVCVCVCVKKRDEECARPFKITAEDTLKGKKSKRGLKGGCKEHQNSESAKKEKL